MSFVDALGWTLIQFLWQGAVVALLFGMVKAVLRRRTANLRYLASCAAMLLMLAFPVLTFLTLSNGAAGTETVSPPPAPNDAHRMTGELRDTFQLHPGVNHAAATETEIWNLRAMVSEFVPLLTALWLAGVALLSLRLLCGWLYARSLSSHDTGLLPDEWQQRVAELCRRIRVLRPVRILESALVEVPTVIGWIRPVVLIPASALVRLTPRQLEAVIAHELAHIRRYDYLVNLLQTAVEILLFYHPAVWWVSRAMSHEREHCCDDVAVEACGNALTYARALVEIEALRGLRPQLGMAADGGSLPARIQRILGISPKKSEPSASWIIGAILIALILVSAAGAQLLPPGPPANESVMMNAAPSRAGEADEPAAIAASLEAEERRSSRKQSAKSGKDNESSSAVEPQQPQGSGPSFIDELAALGYTNLSVDDLIALKDHGVTPRFVRELKDQGHNKLSVRQLIQLKDAGVSPQFIKELGELGYKDVTPDKLVGAAGHGVTPEFIRGLQAAGHKGLAIDDVIRARDHGLTPEFTKAVREQGYDGLTIAQIIRMRDHGVDVEFMRGMNTAGWGRIPIDQLVRAHDHGVDPEFIGKVRSAGYADASLDQLIRLRDHGATPDYVESIRKAGYDKVPLDQLIRLRDHGIDAEFIRRAKSKGFQNLSLDQLIRLREAGVLD